MEPYGIGLIGCGTVGSGVAKLLLEHEQRLSARAGRKLVLRKVVVRDLDKPRQVTLPRDLLTTDLQEVLDDPDIQIAVEVVGGVTWAKDAILKLLAAGKHIVTANKALLALHGEEVFSAAREHNKAIAFEAAVAGGVPVVAAVTQNLAANQISGVLGILNGTSNYILTAMTESGRSYDEALAEAQALGYAEADPTFDIDGTDAAHKLAILSHIAFGVPIPFDAIDRIGIAAVHQADVQFAQELGYTIKLLAEAWVEADELALHVAPVLLRQSAPLAQVRGSYNAIQFVGDAVGDVLYYGRGAGQMPTASAVVADIIDMAVGRAQRTFQTLRLWTGKANGVSVRPKSSVSSKYCLRLQVEDRPGVLAEVTNILAKHEISISSVIQHESGVETATMIPLILMTHVVQTGVFLEAVAEIETLAAVQGSGVYYSVAD
ncbi:MAG: homoserine dehydrogenase [Gemmataceae bacterium]